MSMKNSIQNIVVRMPNWVGDLVMATPVLTDLRQAYPNATITAMCRFPICDLLKTDESIDELFCFHKEGNQFKPREEKRDIIAKLQAGKFDLGILLTNSFSSSWLFWQGNVQRRIGYAHFPRSLLLTDSVAFPCEKQHQVDLYKGLLKPLGIERSSTSPRIYVEDQEIEAAQALLYKRGYQTGSKLIGMNPGAAYGAAKCWPSERYQKLAKELLKEDVWIVFFGDGGSREMIQKICQELGERAINLAGFTTIRELACLIQECDVLVTNDSGPMHIGSALGTPLVALFGSTDRHVTGPYGQFESVVCKEAACSPCLKRVCPIDFRCMTEISVEEVADRVRQKCFGH